VASVVSIVSNDKKQCPLGYAFNFQDQWPPAWLLIENQGKAFAENQSKN
jgi:hypothetical protein